jgi:hypothetical protein
MSRITQLLAERITPQYTAIDGLKYTKYSNKVNLLRILIMMETLDDPRDFPKKDKFEKVIMDKASEDIVKLLGIVTNKYTPIVTALKKGKTQKEIAPLKEKFYKSFFPVLLDGLDLKLQPNTLATKFAKTKHGSLTKDQISTIIKIVKSIEKGGIALEQKDKMELMSIKTSLGDEEEVLTKAEETPTTPTSEPETSTEEIPADDKQEAGEETPTKPTLKTQKEAAVAEIQKTLETKSDDEVQTIADDVEFKKASFTNKKEQKQNEQQQIAQELDYPHLSPAEFTSSKFNIKSTNPEHTAKIGQIRDDVIAKIDGLVIGNDSEKANKTKKFLGQMASDIVESMVNFTPETFGHMNLTNEFVVNGNNIFMSLEDEENGFTFKRNFTLGPDGTIETVKHELFELPKEAQGTGISKSTIADNLILYKAAGVKEIKLHANINLGGYVWLRYGFKPNPESAKEIPKQLANMGQTVIQQTTSNQKAMKLVEHFENSGLDLFYAKIKQPFLALMEEHSGTGAIARKIRETLTDDAMDESVKVNEPVNIFAQAVADGMKKAGEKFEVNPDTIARDIATAEFKVKIGGAYDFIDASEMIKSVPSHHRARMVDDANKKLKELGLEIGGKPVALTKQGKVSVKIEENITFKIKHMATLNSITINKEGTLAYPELSNTGQLTALNWHGGLNVQDPDQFDQALSYATAEKKK